MWHIWYLVGAGAGFAAALFIIVRAARELRGESAKETRASMIWPAIGALLMMPFSGFMAAAAIYMVTR